MKPVSWDDFDFNYNDRYKRRLKRKRFDIRSFENNTCNHSSKGALEDNRMGDGMIDDDYRTFLCHFGGFTELRHSMREENNGDGNGEDDNDPGDPEEDNGEDDTDPGVPEEDNGDGNGEDDTDPQYKMFLEKLRENGKSYILEVAKNSGMSECIKYEAQGGSDDECDPQPKRKLRNTKEREKTEAAKDLRKVRKGEKIAATRDVRNVQSSDKAEQPKILGKVRGIERRNSVIETNLRSVHISPVPHGTQKLTQEDNRLSEPQHERDTGDTITDSCYQLFLNSVQIEGDRMECAPQTQRKLRNIKKGEKIKPTKYLRNVRKGEKIAATRDTRNVQSSDKVEQPKILGKVPGIERRNSVVEKHLRSVHVSPLPHGTQGCSSQKLPQEDNHISEPQHERGTEDIITDRCYQSFLNGVQLEGDCIVFTINSGKRLKYEEDDVETSSDSEILIMDNDPHCGEGNFTPLVIAQVFDASTEGDEEWQCLGNPSRNGDSHFREKLMGILQRPYNQEEFEKLLQEVNVRKAMGGHRDLRTGIKLFSANKSSKSYLDHYDDLKRKLDTVWFDRPKMLNILRGFFYWLQNLSHKGAFKPWADPSCLAVMPGTP